MRQPTTLVRSLLAVVLLTNACAFALQAPTPRERQLAEARWEKEQKEWTAETDPQGNFVHPAYRDSDAYCKNIQVYGNSAFTHLIGWGWFVSSVGAAGVGGLTAGAAKADETREAALLAGGAGISAVITALGVYMIDMGSNGRRSAAEAGAALAEKDDAERWKQCTAALKAWGSSNADTAQEAGKVIADAIKKGGKDGDDSGDDKKNGEKKKADAKGQGSSPAADPSKPASSSAP